MKPFHLLFITLAFLTCTTSFADNSQGARLGVGVNYFVALDDIDTDDIDEDGFSYILTYKNQGAGLIGFQVDLELLPDFYGEDAYAPAAYVVLGSGLYIAAGVGIVNIDSEWAEDPFFAFKAGLDLALTSHLSVDVGASYRFDSELELDDAVDGIDTDTVFLGGAVRWAF